MSTAVWSNRLELDSLADKALNLSARFWFVVAVAGQLMFAVYILSFYGRSVLANDFNRWNRILFHGYVSGDTMGNFALGVHILMAALITLGGPLQLIPKLRSRFPVFHRWNGRLYLLTAYTTSIAALYLTWIRGGNLGDFSQRLGSSLAAVLILFFGALAVRYAIVRDFRTHRRWAIRLFLVVSGSWLFRVGLMLSLLVFKRPVGFDPVTFEGPFITFLQFAEYLVPLAVLELYLRAQERHGAARRIAMAATLFVLTLAMGAGIVGATMAMWIPNLKASVDNRKSIIGPLSETVQYRGIDAAIKQYQDLKAAAGNYNFDEGELNALGYHLIHIHKVKEAIRIFQLNIEVYPQSGDAYDSLAEGYFDAADKTQAIANYQKSLRLGSKNGNGVVMLQKLNAPLDSTAP